MKRLSSVAAVVVVAGALVACEGASGDDVPVLPTMTMEAKNYVDVVGMRLDAAEEALAAAGTQDVTSEAVVDGEGIRVKSDWRVTEQYYDGLTVRLGVKIDPVITQGPVNSPPPAESGSEGDLAAQSAELEQAIKQRLGVVNFADLLAVDDRIWGGYIGGVEVEESGNAVITLQITWDEPGRQDMGSRAARALTTLLPASTVTKINTLTVQDANEVVLARETPRPIL